ncbi:MAG: hypothetical protein WB714_27005, partial [Candidatus Sulfotelmatobacter sp.]
MLASNKQQFTSPIFSDLQTTLAHPFFGGHDYGFFAFFVFFHRARAAFFARLDRSSALMPFAVVIPPCWPRQTGQY